jgi:tetratricopeptide (TPR) repeat protein
MKFIRGYIVICLLATILSTNAFAQTRVIDSLKNVLKTEQEDTNRVKTLIALSNELKRRGKYDTSIICASSAITVAEKLASSSSPIVVKASKKGIAKTYNNIGIIYDEQGNYPKALEYYFKALKMEEDAGDKGRQADVSGNIGIVYREQGDEPKALEYYLKTLQIKEELGDKEGQARVMGNIGNAYSDQGDNTKALEYFLKALKMAEESGYKKGQAINTGNIGNIYKDRRDYTKALEYYFKSLKMAEELGNKQLQANNTGNIGEIYMKTGKFKESEEYLKKTIALDSMIGYLNELSVCEQIISQLYDTTGRSNLALVWYKKAMILKDTLFNIDKNKALTSKELNYQFEKKEAAEKAEQDKKDAVAMADKRKQQITIYAVLCGMALILVFVGFILRSLRVTRKQKQDIEVKNRVIEEKQKDILDSITYAKRLQDAILPPLSLIKHILPESFVIYKPKDIVAGDFYWMERSGDNVLIAAADSTGHGVPGAMTSVVCSNALNRALNEFKIYDTGKLLDKTRDLVLETFAKSEGEIKDGMDISLCAINSKASLLEWSGANNPLWYARNGEIKEILPDKQPIGKHERVKPFTTHTIELIKGDILYLFTDGYADQFGGPKGKKFKYKQLQELLLANASKPMEEQKKILETTLESWKGSLEQVDDILIIGIRV